MKQAKSGSIPFIKSQSAQPFPTYLPLRFSSSVRCSLTCYALEVTEKPECSWFYGRSTKPSCAASNASHSLLDQGQSPLPKNRQYGRTAACLNAGIREFGSETDTRQNSRQPT